MFVLKRESPCGRISLGDMTSFDEGSHRDFCRDGSNI